MLYMLSKNRHRLGNLNFNQIKQVCLNDVHDVHIQINEIVLDELELIHDPSLEIIPETIELVTEETPIMNVSSQVEKMEEVIKQQKVVRKLNRKNSW